MSRFASDTESFSSVDFRRVLSRFPTGMVAITSFDEEPVGLAVGSFSSISLRPPLVGFFVDRSSTTWPRIERTGRFAVNVLGEHQAEICKRFGIKGVDRFAGSRWVPSADGLPLLEGALAWIECEISAVSPTGDHVLAIGSVQRLRDSRGGEPLIFFGGSLIGLASAVREDERL